MEEDIKILEELSKKTIVDILGYSRFVLRSEYRLPLENLLKRYKELEEKETEKFLKVLEDNSKTTLVKEVMELRAKLQDYVPISVIQNKKNEYEKMLKATYTDPTYSGDNRRRECLEALQVLQELLEERNK